MDSKDHPKDVLRSLRPDGPNLLEPGIKLADLLRVEVFLLQGLLLAQLERLEVVTDDAEFLLELDDLAANAHSLLTSTSLPRRSMATSGTFNYPNTK